MTLVLWAKNSPNENDNGPCEKQEIDTKPVFHYLHFLYWKCSPILDVNNRMFKEYSQGSIALLLRLPPWRARDPRQRNKSIKILVYSSRSDAYNVIKPLVTVRKRVHVCGAWISRRQSLFDTQYKLHFIFFRRKIKNKSDLQILK